MTKTASDLYDAVMALPVPERAEFAELLAASVEPPAGLHPAWGPELRRRAAQLDSGEVQGVTREEFRRGMQAILDESGVSRG